MCRNVSIHDFFFLQSRTIQTTSGNKGIFGNDGKTFTNSWPTKGWTEEFDKFHACDPNLPAGVRYCNPGMLTNAAFFGLLKSHFHWNRFTSNTMCVQSMINAKQSQQSFGPTGLIIQLDTATNM